MHIYQLQIQEFLHLLQSACQADWCRHEDTEQATGSAPSCRSTMQPVLHLFVEERV